MKTVQRTVSISFGYASEFTYNTEFSIKLKYSNIRGSRRAAVQQHGETVRREQVTDATTDLA